MSMGASDRESNSDAIVVASATKPALEQLYDYFIKETQGDPIPFDRMEKFNLFLEILGASAGVYTWPPAAQFAQGKPDWYAKSLIITNPFSSVLFLLRATDDFLDTVIKELKKPRPVAHLLDMPDSNELRIKYAKIMVGSAICAVPFGITTYLFPPPGCSSDACIFSTVIHTGVANAILHAISWGLILTPAFWYYRLPTLPVEKALAWAHERRLNPTARAIERLRKEEKAIYDKYRLHLGTFIARATEELANDYTNYSPVKSGRIRDFQVYQVDGQGNGFFHALADQLQVMNIKNESGQAYTPEKLQELIYANAEKYPALKALFTESAHIDLSKFEGWVELSALRALAKILDVSFHVIRDAVKAHDIIVEPEGIQHDSARKIQLFYSGVRYNSLRSNISTDLVLSVNASPLVLTHNTNDAIAPLALVRGNDASLMTLARLVNKDTRTRASNMNVDTVVGTIGALFMVAGCIGYVASPIYLGSALGLTTAESVAAGFLPAYATAVLCAFYGTEILKAVFNYLTTIDNFKDKFSIEAKMYPTIFALFMIVNTFVAIFSFGTAQQLINTAFKNELWDPIRPFLQGNSIAALDMMSFVSLLGLYSAVVRKAAAKFGGTESGERMAARLLVAGSAMAKRLEQMKGPELIDSIARYSDEDKRRLGIDPTKFNKDKERLASLRQELDGLEIKITSQEPAIVDTWRAGSREIGMDRPLLAGTRVQPQ